VTSFQVSAGGDSTHAAFNPAHTGRPVPGLQVRPATLADVEGIAAINIEIEGWDMRVDEITPLIVGEFNKIAEGQFRKFVCVAEVNDDIVGYAKLSWVNYTNLPHDHIPVGWAMTGVNVPSKWRRRYIGHAMTQFRIDWLRSSGAQAVFYWTGTCNDSSKALHARFGFELVASDVLIPGHKRLALGWVYVLRF